MGQASTVAAPCAKDGEENEIAAASKANVRQGMEKILAPITTETIAHKFQSGKQIVLTRINFRSASKAS